MTGAARRSLAGLFSIGQTRDRRGRTLVTGAGGQLGRALREEFADCPLVEFTTREELDLTARDIRSAREWDRYDTIINAAAFTRVDEAETTEGRREAWQANVAGVTQLAQLAVEHRMTMVHFSTDYVFDGLKVGPYSEDDRVSPLSVYGQTKAAADAVVSVVPHHYILRTSWVIGEGTNFLGIMRSLAERGVSPRVVNDQVGRLTYASDLASTVRVLLDSDAPWGLYNVTGNGAARTWNEIAREVFAENGRDPSDVTGVSTAEYYRSSTAPTAPRPRNSVLTLDRIDGVLRGAASAPRSDGLRSGT